MLAAANSQLDVVRYLAEERAASDDADDAGAAQFL